MVMKRAYFVALVCLVLTSTLADCRRRRRTDKPLSESSSVEALIEPDKVKEKDEPVPSKAEPPGATETLDKIREVNNDPSPKNIFGLSRFLQLDVFQTMWQTRVEFPDVSPVMVPKFAKSLSLFGEDMFAHPTLGGQRRAFNMIKDELDQEAKDQAIFDAITLLKTCLVNNPKAYQSDSSSNDEIATAKCIQSARDMYEDTYGKNTWGVVLWVGFDAKAEALAAGKRYIDAGDERTDTSKQYMALEATKLASVLDFVTNDAGNEWFNRLPSSHPAWAAVSVAYAERTDSSLPVRPIVTIPRLDGYLFLAELPSYLAKTDKIPVAVQFEFKVDKETCLKDKNDRALKKMPVDSLYCTAQEDSDLGITCEEFFVIPNVQSLLQKWKTTYCVEPTDEAKPDVNMYCEKQEASNSVFSCLRKDATVRKHSNSNPLKTSLRNSATLERSSNKLSASSDSEISVANNIELSTLEDALGKKDKETLHEALLEYAKNPKWNEAMTNTFTATEEGVCALVDEKNRAGIQQAVLLSWVVCSLSSPGVPYSSECVDSLYNTFLQTDKQLNGQLIPVFYPPVPAEESEDNEELLTILKVFHKQRKSQPNTPLADSQGVRKSSKDLEMAYSFPGTCLGQLLESARVDHPMILAAHTAFLKLMPKTPQPKVIILAPDHESWGSTLKPCVEDESDNLEMEAEPCEDPLLTLIKSSNVQLLSNSETQIAVGASKKELWRAFNEKFVTEVKPHSYSQFLSEDQLGFY